MKALLMLLVIVAGVWLWRSRQTSLGKPAAPSAPPKPLDMVRCAQCGLHVTSAEAIQGKQGQYCSAEHLQRAET